MSKTDLTITFHVSSLLIPPIQTYVYYDDYVPRNIPRVHEVIVVKDKKYRIDAVHWDELTAIHYLLSPR